MTTVCRTSDQVGRTKERSDAAPAERLLAGQSRDALGDQRAVPFGSCLWKFIRAPELRYDAVLPLLYASLSVVVMSTDVRMSENACSMYPPASSSF